MFYSYYLQTANEISGIDYYYHLYFTVVETSSGGLIVISKVIQLLIGRKRIEIQVFPTISLVWYILLHNRITNTKKIQWLLSFTPARGMDFGHSSTLSLGGHTSYTLFS